MKPLQKINLEGFSPMDSYASCPTCSGRLREDNIIGWGDYPTNGMTGFSVGDYDLYGIGEPAIGYECPVCFEKCCIHALDMKIPKFEWKSKEKK